MAYEGLGLVCRNEYDLPQVLSAGHAGSAPFATSGVRRLYGVE